MSIIPLFLFFSFSFLLFVPIHLFTLYFFFPHPYLSLHLIHPVHPSVTPNSASHYPTPLALRPLTLLPDGVLAGHTWARVEMGRRSCGRSGRTEVGLLAAPHQSCFGMSFGTSSPKISSRAAGKLCQTHRYLT
jgi:hypothetical protein